LLYYFVRGTLSPSFTPCKGDNIPLDPGMPPSAVFIIYLKVNAVAVTGLADILDNKNASMI